MKYLYTITLIMSTLLIFVASDGDRGKGLNGQLV